MDRSVREEGAMNVRDRARVNAAMHDPSSVYASPMEVVNDEGLGQEDKRRILASWHTDALLLSEAEEENMGGGERARLREVLLALAELERRAAMQ
jgi:hypothetical protein